MLSQKSGRRPTSSAVTRSAMVSVMLLGTAALAGCTTTEGTNAFSDIGTFEREVMTETMMGMGVIDRTEKPETENRRGPLVLPKNANALPSPQQSGESKVALLPEDSGTVRLDASGLSEEDVRRLRNARVVDATTLSGRPLTPEEQRKLTARMTAAQLQAGQRPLYLPPVEYFTTVKGKDMVCLASSGELVPLDDAACPPAIRNALAQGQ